MGVHHTPSQTKAPAGSSPPDGFKRVYYLTPTQFAISNVALQRIKVARFSDLNDPFELLGVDRSNVKNRHALRKKTGKINDETGLLCFSKSWSNPVLWGHYAERHTGICMGFDVAEDHLHEVIYEESLGHVKGDAKTGELVLTTKEIDRLMSTKFKDWEYEQEMRFFVKLSRLQDEAGKFFYPFSKKLVLRELILGPKCEIEIDAVRRLVDKNVTAQKARLAFRKFAVVVDKKASMI
jgi:hypothetical protein